jgi:hypothetical protein
MKINIEIISHSKQRYETPGDYWVDENGDVQVRVSELGNETFEAAIFIHELIEFFLIRKKGTPTEPEIMAFDIEFEKYRKLGKVNQHDEPGFSENSPYRQEHTIATACEMAFIGASGESWNNYENKVLSLLNGKP